jgi:lysophospholipid acyltransferase (LPLAT)-like uncharacterized protein
MRVERATTPRLVRKFRPLNWAFWSSCVGLWPPPSGSFIEDLYGGSGIFQAGAFQQRWRGKPLANERRRNAGQPNTSATLGRVLPGGAMKALLRTPQAQAMLASLLSFYLVLALRTTRWTLDGQEHFRPHGAGAPAVFAFWHEFLPLMPALSLIAHKLPFYRPTPIHTLVSQHRDGQFIGAVVRRFGILPILGSSTRGGATGMRNLLAVLRKGELIGITPDGPKGPPRQAAFGVAQLAALSGVPVVPLAARTTRRVHLDTWDRMPVPLPFGRGVMVCGPAIRVPRHDWKNAIPAITKALNEVAARADLLCPA